jgi:hypothetical protein
LVVNNERWPLLLGAWLSERTSTLALVDPRPNRRGTASFRMRSKRLDEPPSERYADQPRRTR